MPDLSSVISALEQQRSAIDRALEALRAVSSTGGDGAGTHSARANEQPAPKKRRMSAEGRRRIAEAARKRWAAVKKANAGAGDRKKGGISAVGRKRLSAAMK